MFYLISFLMQIWSFDYSLLFSYTEVSNYYILEM